MYSVVFTITIKPPINRSNWTVSSLQQPFFVERVFHIFDKDDNGSISLQEFIDAMHQFAGQSPDDKIKFLFKVYDIDGELIFFALAREREKNKHLTIPDPKKERAADGTCLQKILIAFL